MTIATTRVHGLRELRSALREMDKRLDTEFGHGLLRAVDPVVGTAREKVTRFAGSSPGTIRARRSGVRVHIEQSKAKTTGTRGDFGALQMRTVLIPALDEKEPAVFDAIDDLLGDWTRKF